METVLNKENLQSNKQYTQVKVSVASEIAAKFKMACATESISMSAVLSKFMADYAKYSTKQKVAQTQNYTTRRKRRAAVKRIIIDLRQIKSAEESLIDNAPENLQDAPIYETAQDYIDALDDVIDRLSVMVP